MICRARRLPALLTPAILLIALDAGSSVAQESLPGSDVLFVEQGWDEDERRLFYNEPQGSPILPLSWFLALERPDRERPFRDDALRP